MTTSSALRREPSARPTAVTMRVRAAHAAMPTTGRIVVASTGIAVVVVTGAWFAATPLAAAVGLSLLVLVVAALVDAVEHRLPNALVAAAAVPPTAVACLALVATTEPFAGLAAGAALLGGPLLGVHLVAPVGMGFGDVKAGTVLGAALGLVHPPLALFALLAACAIAVGWALLTGRRAVPFGPGLVGGAILVLGVARLVGVEATTWS